jgi:hypothetical protein
MPDLNELRKLEELDFINHITELRGAFTVKEQYLEREWSTTGLSTASKPIR